MTVGKPNLCLLVEFSALKAITFLCLEAFSKIPLWTRQPSQHKYFSMIIHHLCIEVCNVKHELQLESER